MKRLFFIPMILVTLGISAQQREKAFIRLVQPSRETNAVHGPTQFVSGATCTDCELTINGLPVKVQSTGGFAHELTLIPGANNITIQAKGAGSSEATRRPHLSFHRS